MFDRGPMNGSHASPTPYSTTDILLAEFRSELRTDMREIRSDLGDVRAQVATLRGEARVSYHLTQDAIRKLFHTTDVLRVEVARQKAERSRPHGPRRTGRAGLLRGLTELLTALGEVLSGTWKLALLTAWAAAAAGVTVKADLIAEVLRSLR